MEYRSTNFTKGVKTIFWGILAFQSQYNTDITTIRVIIAIMKYIYIYMHINYNMSEIQFLSVNEI